MRDYYAIYDTDKQKYFVGSSLFTIVWSGSELFAKRFCSKLAAKMFITMAKELRQKDSLCVEMIAEF